jgi:hypothetical protein
MPQYTVLQCVCVPLRMCVRVRVFMRIYMCLYVCVCVCVCVDPVSAVQWTS